jgi:hypothetical protein
MEIRTIKVEGASTRTEGKIRAEGSIRVELTVAIRGKANIRTRRVFRTNKSPQPSPLKCNPTLLK